MSKTVSFIPYGIAADGSHVWGIGPDANALEISMARRTLLPGRADKPSVATKKSVAGLTDWQVNKIIRYIDEHIDTGLRVRDLGLQVKLSVSRFSKGFKISFGQPPYDYVLTRRIEAAKRLISNTDEPLSQVAHACGLSDQAHLSKVFKRIVGTTPLKWRQGYLAGHENIKRHVEFAKHDGRAAMAL
jgi:AraC-like DNA-binding protein